MKHEFIWNEPTNEEKILVTNGVKNPFYDNLPGIALSMCMSLLCILLLLSVDDPGAAACAMLPGLIFFVLFLYIYTNERRIKKSKAGSFLVMRGKCIKKEVETGFNPRDIKYCIWLSQNENSDNLLKTSVLQSDFNEAESDFDFIAVVMENHFIFGDDKYDWDETPRAYLKKD